MVLIILLIIIRFCCPRDEGVEMSLRLDTFNNESDSIELQRVEIHQDILVENYFQYVDSIVCKYDSLTNYPLTEHLLVRANSWIIDTLQHTDYYLMKARDSFVYNQKKMIALRKGAFINIPDSIAADQLLYAFQQTKIDINIPEFTLRIYEDSVQLYKFLVRVGRNEKKYLEMSGRIQDLKTKTGEGTIVRHVRNPRYVNPVNNHEYFVTRRDDQEVTKLPQIPFIETELNGVRHGQLIHPTTNPVTLGKAYSNGCIGTNEADAWILYYYAPIGTKIKIRYDLNVQNEKGEQIVLKDIYQ
ncbi:L,D-transpeptidase [Kordia aestuariivivens]|nr:L,D-transpeptidase [Kordia aestuariivivens]